MGHGLLQNRVREKEQTACGCRGATQWVAFLSVSLAARDLQHRNSCWREEDEGGRWSPSLISEICSSAPQLVHGLHGLCQSCGLTGSRSSHTSELLCCCTLPYVLLGLVPTRSNLTSQHACLCLTVQGDTLQSLFTSLQRKAGEESTGYVVGAGWVKYEWNSAFWDLDDGRSDIRRVYVCRGRKLKNGNT